MRTGQTYAWFPDGEVRALVPDGGFWFQACVHPEGDHVVSWGGTRGLPRMWRTDLDAPPRSAEAFGPQGARHPSYGLLGDRLVFAAEPAPAERLEDTFAEVASGMSLPGTTLDIWTCGPDGRDLQQVTDGPHHDERPCLSPDGTTVAFVSDRQPAGVWLVPADGSAEPRPVVEDGFFGYRPWFLLDGRALATFSLVEPRQVHLVDLETEQVTAMPADELGNTHGPFADPSGDRLLVHSNRSGPWRLWELPLDGSPMVELHPPGFDGQECGHPTRAANGVLAFDAGATTMDDDQA